jgi:hypothetical protein
MPRKRKYEIQSEAFKILESNRPPELQCAGISITNAALGHLGSLPREIRDEIYYYVLAGTKTALRFKESESASRPTVIRLPELAKASKSLCEEVAQASHIATVYHLVNPSAIDAISTSPTALDPHRLGTVTHLLISIDLSAYSWIIDGLEHHRADDLPFYPCNPVLCALNEIPRFEEAIYLFSNLEYLAVKLSNTVDYADPPLHSICTFPHSWTKHFREEGRSLRALTIFTEKSTGWLWNIRRGSRSSLQSCTISRGRQEGSLHGAVAAIPGVRSGFPEVEQWLNEFIRERELS